LNTVEQIAKTSLWCNIEMKKTTRRSQHIHIIIIVIIKAYTRLHRYHVALFRVGLFSQQLCDKQQNSTSANTGNDRYYTNRKHPEV